MDPGVLLPEKLQRDAVSLQLAVDVCTVGPDPVAHRRRAGEQPGFERPIIQLGRQRPAEPALRRPAQITVDRPHADAAGPGHRLVGQSLLVSEL